MQFCKNKFATAVLSDARVVHDCDGSNEYDIIEHGEIRTPPEPPSLAAR